MDKTTKLIMEEYVKEFKMMLDLSSTNQLLHILSTRFTYRTQKNATYLFNVHSQ